MKSVYNFVIKPLGERYNNKKKVGDKNLILNTEIYNHEYVNREGVVISCPIVGDTSIKPGDKVIVHHNVFRRWHDVKGVEKNSKAWFSEDKYIVCQDQISEPFLPCIVPKNTKLWLQQSLHFQFCHSTSHKVEEWNLTQ